MDEGGVTEDVESSPESQSPRVTQVFVCNILSGGGRETEQTRLLLEPYANDTRLKAYQISVSKEAAYQENERKAKLRNKVEHWRKEVANVAGSGIDPLLVFPEEIWTNILENLTDWRDLTSCANANHLFDRILTPTKVQYHFEKVLPFVLNFLGDEKVLDCRLVCKQWCSSVDNYLENCKTIDEEVAGQFRFRYHDYRFDFSIPLDHGDEEEQYVKELRYHPRRNPFIGRSIKIRAEGEWPNYLEPPQFLPELEMFLGSHGQHIWHLCLKSANSRFVFQTFMSYYSACVQFLTQCSNLRSLFLDGRRIKIQQQNQNGGNILLALDSLPHHAYLESLELEMNRPHEIKIQDKLIEKYSGQLKRLKVHLWNCALYQVLSWENLTHLQITIGMSDELIYNLMHLNAPKLRKLSLCLKGKAESSMLEQLMRLLSKFESVDSLQLRYSNGFHGFTANQIISLPAGRAFSALINTVEIGFSSPVAFLFFDILIAFPCLKNLIIRVHQDELEPNELTEMNQFLRISEYLSEILNGGTQRDTTMYYSNVWEAVPSLQVFEVRYFEYEEFLERYMAKRQVYTKQEYLREKMDRKSILNTQLNCSHREADRQNRMKSTLLRQKLGSQRVELAAGRIDNGGAYTRPTEHWTDKNELENCSKSGQQLLPKILEKINTHWLFEKILPLILTKLDKSDILNCRQVCRKWCTGVDNVMACYHSSTKWTRPLDTEPFVGSYTPNAFYGFNYNYTFHASLPKDAIRDTMSHLVENPFIGRSVCFNLTRHQQDSEQVEEFVQLFGEHIWHFALSSGIEDNVRVHPNGYYDMFRKILANCPNLRTLYLSKTDVNWSSWEPTHNFPPPVLSHFENLRVEELTYHNPYILLALLERYSSQLKCFNTCYWSSFRTCSLPWDRLEELHVSDSWQLLNSLTKIRAPNLTRLYIRLEKDTESQSQLKTLIAVTHNLPTLTELRVKLNKGFNGFTPEEAKNMVPGFIAPALLTTLQLIISKKVSLSFDFLIFFPHLRRLCVREFTEEMGEKEDTDDEHDSDEDRDSWDYDESEDESYSEDCDVSFDSDDVNSEQELDDESDWEDISDSSEDSIDKDEPQEEGGNGKVSGIQVENEVNSKIEDDNPEPEQSERDYAADTEFVQFPKNFWEKIPKDKEMYKLNIWQVLRSLHFLEFYKSGSDGARKIYTRQSYDKIRIANNKLSNKRHFE